MLNYRRGEHHLEGHRVPDFWTEWRPQPSLRTAPGTSAAVANILSSPATAASDLLVPKFSSVDPWQSFGIPTRVPKHIRDRTLSEFDGTNLRLGWKGNYSIIYHNTICTNAHNRLNFRGHRFDILASRPLQIWGTRPPSPPPGSTPHAGQIAATRI